MRRVAMVGACPFPVPQGSQAHLADTARVVAAQGHAVTVVVYGYGLGEVPADLRIVRAWSPSLRGRTRAGPSWSKPLHDLSLTARLRSLRGIDLVHAHNYEGLLCALMSARRPIVYQAHNAMADELPHYFKDAGWARRCGALLDRTLPRQADAVIAPHERLAEYLVACGCDAGRVFVIPPAMDAAPHAPVPLEEEIAPVLYTGNLDAYQNLGLLLAAMERVRRALPSARLVIATADACSIAGAEIVPVRDFDSLQAVLQRDAVVACPRVSWSGFPIKLLNAMAAGLPIVACSSAAPGLTDGVDALIVTDNDTDAFAQALMRVMQDGALRRRLGAAAHARVISQHAPAMVGEAIDRVYGALI